MNVLFENTKNILSSSYRKQFDNSKKAAPKKYKLLSANCLLPTKKLWHPPLVASKKNASKYSTSATASDLLRF